MQYLCPKRTTLLVTILWWGSLGIANAQGFIKTGTQPAALRAHTPQHITLAPGDFTLHKQPAILFRPFAMRDPVSKKIVSPNTIIMLPDGRRISAQDYYGQLNKYEQAFNQLGYSMRQKGTFVIGSYNVPYTRLEEQKRQITSQHRAYIPPIPLIKQLQGISLARHLFTQTTPIAQTPSKPLTAQRYGPLIYLPLLQTGPGVQKSAFSNLRLNALRILNPRLYNAMHNAFHKTLLHHDPPASENFPENLDLGDPSSFGAYFHSSVGFAADQNGETFTASADTGGYILGNKVDIAGVGITLKSPLQAKTSGTAQITGSILGNSITPPAVNLSQISISYNLIDKSVGEQDYNLYSTTVMCGPVPVAIEVNLALKITAKLKLEAPQPAEIALQLDPRFRVGVQLQAGIGVGGVVSAGVGGELDLVDIQAPLTATAAMVPGTTANNGNNPANLGLYLDLNWTFEYNILSGKLYVYAQLGPFKAEYDLFSWTGVSVAKQTLFNVAKWDDLGITVPAWLNGSSPTSLPSGQTPQLASISLQALGDYQTYGNGDNTPAGQQLLLQATPYDQFGNYFPCSIQISQVSGTGTLNSGEQYFPSVQGGQAEFKAVSGSVSGVLNLNVGAYYNPQITAVIPNHGKPGDTITLNGTSLAPGSQQLLFGWIPATGLNLPAAAATQTIGTAETMTATVPAQQSLTTPGYVDVGFSGQNPGSNTYSARPPSAASFYYYTPDVPVPLEAVYNSIQLYPPAPAAYGSSTVPIPLQLWNAAGQPEANQSISLSTNSGSFGQSGKQITVTTDANGIAVAYLTSAPLSTSQTNPQPGTSDVTVWSAAKPQAKLIIPILFPPYVQPPKHPFQIGQNTTVNAGGQGQSKANVLIGRFRFVGKKGPEQGWQVYASATGGLADSPVVTDKNGYANVYIYLSKGSTAAKVTVWAASDPSQSITETIMLP